MFIQQEHARAVAKVEALKAPDGSADLDRDTLMGFLCTLRPAEIKEVSEVRAVQGAFTPARIGMCSENELLKLRGLVEECKVEKFVESNEREHTLKIWQVGRLNYAAMSHTK
eukprot:SAG31_NODE_6872_length_1864_cov_3.712181_3_plen_112_part_00